MIRLNPIEHPVLSRVLCARQDWLSEPIYELIVLEWTENMNVRVRYSQAGNEGWVSESDRPYVSECLGLDLSSGDPLTFISKAHPQPDVSVDKLVETQRELMRIMEDVPAAIRVGRAVLVHAEVLGKAAAEIARPFHGLRVFFDPMLPPESYVVMNARELREWLKVLRGSTDDVSGPC